MLFFSCLLLILSANADSSLERSDRLVKSWTSESCQNFNKRGYFSSVENEIGCSTNAVHCPRFYESYKLFDPSHNLSRRWDCKAKFKGSHRMSTQVSHEHKFIWVTITKTGSTSARTVFDKEFNLKEFKSLQRISNVQNIQDYFVFAFVRDPITRIESGMGQFQTNKSHKDILNMIMNGCTYNKHVWTMANYLNVELKNGKKLQYDFIGSLEHYSEDMNWVMKILKMPPSQRRQAVQQERQRKNVRNSLAAADGRKVIVPQQNRGRSHVHSSLNYAEPDTSKKMCKLTSQDYQCFSGLYSMPNFC